MESICLIGYYPFDDFMSGADWACHWRNYWEADTTRRCINVANKAVQDVKFMMTTL